MTKFREISHQDVDAILNRVEAAVSTDGKVSPDDLRLLLDVFKSYLHLHERLERNDLTIQRLRKLLGMVSASEKSSSITPEAEENQDSENNASQAEDAKDADKLNSKGRPHGKQSAEDFEEAKTEYHPHTELHRGDACPECYEGKLYKFDPATFVRITGHAPLQVTIHVMEQLRCNACGKIFRAEPPEEVLADGPTGKRFGWSAVALIVLLKYAAGTPFFRQHVLQRMFKVPIMPSTLWDQCEDCADACKPVTDYLKQMAATANLFFSDDTGNRILNQSPITKKRRGSEKDIERTGVHTSGIVAMLPTGQEIILYKTGINHAGEFMDEVLRLRPSDAPPFIHMSDALSSNAPTLLKPIQALCNTHARRQFVDLYDRYPNECGYVIDTYKEVYRFDAEAKEKSFTQEERLAYHQTNSKPLMTAMFTWAQSKIDNREVEPNSDLGGALKYLLNHEEGLMAFTKHAGGPLDNNIQEQKLKLVILHRKNSLFFKEPVGAAVADVLMSLCATAFSAKINVHEYLVHIMRNAEEVKKHPENFLPWNFSSKNANALEA